MSAVVVPTGPDSGAPWHYGDPLGEQRALAHGTGVVDLGAWDVVRLTGADGLRLLDALGTAAVARLTVGQSATTYFLDGQGHLRHALAFTVIDAAAGPQIWGWTERGRGAALTEYLTHRRFRLDVQADLMPDQAVVWTGDATTAPPGFPCRHGTPDCLGGTQWFVPRTRVASLVDAGRPAGLWAYEARRIAADVPRLGWDTDDRTIPNELGAPSAVVALDKGCYPGQETVAKTYYRGAPPRRLVRLLFDGSQERWVDHGTPLTDGERVVGVLGSMAYHCELGPIGLALITARTNDAATLTADGIAATIDPLVASVTRPRGTAPGRGTK